MTGNAVQSPKLQSEPGQAVKGDLWLAHVLVCYYTAASVPVECENFNLGSHCIRG